MAYPPLPYRVASAQAAIDLMRENPFAYVISASDEILATRTPIVVDQTDGAATRLRLHLDALNPQASAMDGAEVLVIFSGAASYVSPNWRADKTKGGTYDYEEVQVRGHARKVGGLDAFRALIDDLSQLIEPQHAEIADYPIWRTTMSPPGHIERQVDMVAIFAIEISSIQAVAKLHQNFPEADRRSVSEHLSRSAREGSRMIAARIKGALGD